MTTRPKHAALKRRLTELSVRKLKPRPGAYLIWDTLQRGLAIRVQPTGARAWKMIYSCHGRPRWLHLGDAGAIGLADARTLTAEGHARGRQGQGPSGREAGRAGRRDVRRPRSEYLERLRQEAQQELAAGRCARAALPAAAVGQAAGGVSITRGDVRTMMSRIEAPVLANQVLAAASAIFSWATKQEIIAANPCRGVERNETRSRERILCDSEVPRFWAAFDDAGLVAGSALKTILLPGQRPGEVAHMRHEHIVDGWWNMPGEPVPAMGWPGTKNGASTPYLAAGAGAAIIEELSDGATDGFVFAGARGRPVDGLDAAMRAICKKLGVSGRPRTICAAPTAAPSPRSASAATP